jgi:DNA mismatch repair protein MutS
MRQYFEVKDQRPDLLLLMRVGDFYEAYGDDAKTMAHDLDITLTGREDKQAGERIPMAGVPFHAVERYIARLLQLGHKVALCDQVEDPKTAKGLVRRKVTRIITPGTVMEDAFLDARRNNFLVAAVTNERLPTGIGLLDISTGEFLTGDLKCVEGATDDSEIQALIDEIARLAPAECLITTAMEDRLAGPIRNATGVIVTIHDQREVRRSARQQLIEHFGTQSLRSSALSLAALAFPPTLRPVAPARDSGGVFLVSFLNCGSLANGLLEYPEGGFVYILCTLMFARPVGYHVRTLYLQGGRVKWVQKKKCRQKIKIRRGGSTWARRSYYSLLLPRLFYA